MEQQFHKKPTSVVLSSRSSMGETITFFYCWFMLIPVGVLRAKGSTYGHLIVGLRIQGKFKQQTNVAYMQHMI